MGNKGCYVINRRPVPVPYIISTCIINLCTTTTLTRYDTILSLNDPEEEAS